MKQLIAIPLVLASTIAVAQTTIADLATPELSQAPRSPATEPLQPLPKLLKGGGIGPRAARVEVKVDEHDGACQVKYTRYNVGAPPCGTGTYADSPGRCIRQGQDVTFIVLEGELCERRFTMTLNKSVAGNRHFLANDTSYLDPD